MDHEDDKYEWMVGETLIDYNKLYTYSDYLLWDDDKRRELIDGIPFLMSAPNRIHQKILGSLYIQFAALLKGKTCEVYFAPFDVRLNADTYDNTVIQPDLVVVCDQEKLNDAGCKGAPDLAIEVLSPSTSSYDRNLKFNTYQKYGIREYWIIDPVKKTLAVHILTEGNYVTYPYGENDAVSVHVLGGSKIDLNEIFEG